MECGVGFRQVLGSARGQVLHDSNTTRALSIWDISRPVGMDIPGLHAHPRTWRYYLANDQSAACRHFRRLVGQDEDIHSRHRFRHDTTACIRVDRRCSALHLVGHNRRSPHRVTGRLGRIGPSLHTSVVGSIKATWYIHAASFICLKSYLRVTRTMA